MTQGRPPPPPPRSAAQYALDCPSPPLPPPHSYRVRRVHPSTLPVHDSDPTESIYVQRKAQFDNPFASNAEWAPTRADYELLTLPKVDMMLRVKARLNRKAGNPFDPAPRSFQRPPRNAPVAYAPFSPLILKSEGKTGLIGAGFKPGYNGPVLAQHDVSAADFHRFLEDVFTAGKVGAGGQMVAGVAPITMHLGLTGYFVTKAILKGVGRRNEPLVVDTIETWQQRFFGPRGLDVYVVQGGQRCTAHHVGGIPGALSDHIARDVHAMATDFTERKRKDRKKLSETPYLVIEPLYR